MRQARRREEVHEPAEMHEVAAHEILDEVGRIGGDIGESLAESELSPFQRGMESPMSPPGEGLTARDILEGDRLFEDGGEGFEMGEHAEAGPLGDPGLGMDPRANIQVMIARLSVSLDPCPLWRSSCCGGVGRPSLWPVSSYCCT